MRIIELLRKCPYNKIKDKIKLHYGTKDLNKYEELYYQLIEVKTNVILDDFFICINAYRVGDEEDTKIDVFDENDTSLYFDVSGYEISSDILYSIASACYSDFIQYKVDEKTLNNFTCETILAHCFFEVTAYSFEDNT